MHVWKSLVLEVCYCGSYPYRWWTNLHTAAEHRLPVVVLFYHRIADDSANSWTISTRSFARQVGWLRDYFDVVSLAEAQRRIRVGDNTRPCVSITFDDGYAENCREAIPLLVRNQLPCTYFVTLRNVLDAQPFPHDLARGDHFPPNSIEQIRAMASAGIEIGAHTYTHLDLGRISDEERLRHEVVDAREELQALVGRPVRYFAFPFGQYVNMNSRAIELARQAGYEGVCSAYGGYNVPGDDDFHIQRTSANESMSRFKNRATIDPRKIGIPRFRYEMRDEPSWTA